MKPLGIAEYKHNTSVKVIQRKGRGPKGIKCKKLEVIACCICISEYLSYFKGFYLTEYLPKMAPFGVIRKVIKIHFI